MPQQCDSQKIVENPLVYHNAMLFSVLRILFFVFGDYELEKMILTLFMVIEQEFSTTLQILRRPQSEVNSLAFVLFQTPHALDTLAAQQGRDCNHQ